MNVKNQKKIPFPIYQGTPDETRDMVISRFVDHLNGNTYLPPEFYTTLASLINQKFLESPVEAIHKDLQDLSTRVKHIEATQNLQNRPQRYAANR